jgi:FkbM family methyltransferase
MSLRHQGLLPMGFHDLCHEGVLWCLNLHQALIYTQNATLSWVVFDIGAFIGFYTVLFGRLCGPEGKVIAFEPIEGLSEQMLRSCRANRLHNVAVEAKAVGAQNTESEFWAHEDQKSGFGTSSSLRRRAGFRPMRVPLVTLDSYVLDGSLKRVDLIKIDVEGTEIDVLEGALKTLELFKPIVLVEFNRKEDRVLGELFLQESGYSCREIGSSSYGVHIVATHGEKG